MITITALRAVAEELKLGEGQIIAASSANAVKHVLAAADDGLLHRGPNKHPGRTPGVSDPRVAWRAMNDQGQVMAWSPTEKGAVAFGMFEEARARYAGDYQPLTVEGKREAKRRDQEVMERVSAAVSEWEGAPKIAPPFRIPASLTSHARAAAERMLAAPPPGFTVEDVQAFITRNASQMATKRPARKASVTFPKDVLGALQSLETADIDAAIVRVNRLGDNQCRLPDVEEANLNVKACDGLRDQLVAWRDSPIRAMLVRERRRGDGEEIIFGKSGVRHFVNYRKD